MTPGILGEILRGLDRLIFPPLSYCLGCGREGNWSGGVCPSCLAAWREELRPGCVRCGRPWLAPAAPGEIVCSQCAGADLPWDHVRPLGLYRGSLRRLLWRFKYRGERWLAGPLGELLAGVALANLSPPQVLVPVPLAPYRLRSRGFNQAEELARVVGRRWRVPVVRALVRKGRRFRQTGLGKADRWRNLAGAFLPLLDLAGATIVMVDDVMTTGATMAHCAWALRQAGASRVDGLVLATVTVAEGMSDYG